MPFYNQLVTEKAAEQNYPFTSLPFTNHCIITLLLSLALKNSLFISSLYFIIIQKAKKKNLSLMQYKQHFFRKIMIFSSITTLPITQCGSFSSQMYH